MATPNTDNSNPAAPAAGADPQPATTASTNTNPNALDADPGPKWRENNIWGWVVAGAVLLLLAFVLWLTWDTKPCDTECGIAKHAQTVTSVGQDQLVPITTDNSDVVFKIVTDFGTTARLEAAAHGDHLRDEALKNAQSALKIAKIDAEIDQIEHNERQRLCTETCTREPAPAPTINCYGNGGCAKRK